MTYPLSTSILNLPVSQADLRVGVPRHTHIFNTQITTEDNETLHLKPFWYFKIPWGFRCRVLTKETII